MPALQTPLCDFGVQPIDFILPNIDGTQRTLADCQGKKGTLIMFICNHCPFVKSVINALVIDAKELIATGISVVAICSNDSQQYPEDSFDNMKKFAAMHDFCFPYLHDANQQVAKAYQAVCTPDFFGYSATHALQYRGRYDKRGASVLQKKASTEPSELRLAMQQIIDTGEGPKEQIPSIGCSIKWK